VRTSAGSWKIAQCGSAKATVVAQDLDCVQKIGRWDGSAYAAEGFAAVKVIGNPGARKPEIDMDFGI